MCNRFDVMLQKKTNPNCTPYMLSRVLSPPNGSNLAPAPADYDKVMSKYVRRFVMVRRLVCEVLMHAIGKVLFISEPG